MRYMALARFDAKVLVVDTDDCHVVAACDSDEDAQGIAERLNSLPLPPSPF